MLWGGHFVRLGLRYVKDLGEEGARAIVAEREKGAFSLLQRFLLSTA